ncbi:MAG: HI0074 family nucleotidyltransferase substrate-binding subunit, partial [Firmicutes bacterium]|nr:HI0074 family nucleotidyltransferase substrate-binding subunit [Bacillota bacterium]
TIHGFEEVNTGSPRMTIKTAYKAGMIRDEQLWLEALDSRNNASHAYNHSIALGIVHKTKNAYIKMFEKLEITLLEEWIE